MNTTTNTCRQDDTVSHMDRGRRQMLEDLARKEGTPIFVIDHKKIRDNYREFKENLPKIQVYLLSKRTQIPIL